MTGPLGLFGVVAVVIFAGVANALPPKKIVGSTAATPGEFPYMVSLRYLDEHLCGGAIVSPRHIVTAAHCFQDVDMSHMDTDIYVATGSVFSDDGEHHALRKVISHPDYDRESDLVHDIAVIVLADEIVFDENQASLGLATEFVPEGVFANFTGWGLLDENREAIPSELMKINVKTLRNHACNGYFREPINIRSSQICTFGGLGVGACTYDSGSPLVYNGKLIGVSSSGLPCARGFPDVFTSVYHHLAWLKKTMEE